MTGLIGMMLCTIVMLFIIWTELADITKVLREISNTLRKGR